MTDDDLAGKVVGSYEILRLLGTGSMGVIYAAAHVTTRTPAVVKYLQDRLIDSDEHMRRLFNEARTAASIPHPGIVGVFDYGRDDDGRGYIVMELLEGENLRTRLDRASPLAIDLAVAIAVQVADTLAAAHRASVIHRDLKPDNVFLVPDAAAPHGVRVKVLDFGLAKNTDDPAPRITQTGLFVGTPLYMSPEQGRVNGVVDHRTDQYSLACVLFEMVCGRPPFQGRTVGDLIIAHNTTPPPAPSELAPSIPRELERTILRALAKHPDDRFATMSAFSSALAPPAPAHVTERVSRVSLDEPASPPAGSRRVLVGGLLAGIVLAILAILALLARG